MKLKIHTTLNLGQKIGQFRAIPVSIPSLNQKGEVLANVGGTVAMANKMLDKAGEQIMCYYENGEVKIWYDDDAVDSERAQGRYAMPFYKRSQSLSGTGYNILQLGGI